MDSFAAAGKRKMNMNMKMMKMNMKNMNKPKSGGGSSRDCLEFGELCIGSFAGGEDCCGSLDCSIGWRGFTCH